MKKLLTSVLFMSALVIGLFGNVVKVEAQYETQYCDKATLTQSIDTKRQNVQLWFEYWTSNNPNAVKITDTRYYQNKDIVVLSETIERLTPNTQYSFRMVAEINTKTTKSSIASFTTPSCPLPTVKLKVNGKDTALVEKDSVVTLSWDTTPSSGNSCKLYANNTDERTVNPNSTGYQVGPITKNTTFTLVCLNGTGRGEGSVSVTVNQPRVNPTVNIYAIDKNGNKVESITIPHGDSINIGWTSTNTNDTSCTASGSADSNWSGNKNTSGTFNTGSLTSAKTYNIFCNGVQGTVGANDSVTVNVSGQPANPTLTFSANKTSVANGGSFDLKWSTKNATTCNSSSSQNDWNGGRRVDNNNQIIYTVSNFTKTTTYSMTCNGGVNTTPVTRSVTVNLQTTQQTFAPTVDLSASDTDITAGESIVLSWSSSNNPTYCSNNWSTSNNTSGSATVYPTATKTYSVTCSNSAGSDSDSVTVTVNSSNPQTPTVNLSASDTDITNGDSVTLTWSSSNANYCSASWTSNTNTSGSATVYPTTSKPYSISCSGNGGSVTDSEYITVNNNQNQNDVYVSTNSASSIGNNYATLNGYVSSNDNGDAIAWFEYGTNSYSYSYQTSKINRGSTNGTNYSYYADNLNSNTTYYFRAVAKNASGVEKRGTEYSFTTTGGNSGGCTSNCGNAYVTTNSASVNSSTTVTLNGYLNTDGNYFSVKWFEYGVGYNTNIKKNDISHYSYSSGNFSDTLTGLSPNTLYSYRAVAKNSNGQTIYGSTVQFTTSGNTTTPTNNPCTNSSCAAVTTFATSIGSTSARLNGLGLTDTSLDNTGWFEWSVNESDVSNGLGIKTGLQNIGSDVRNSFSESLFSLGSSKTYFYRAVMKNAYGTYYGEVVSFRTNASSTTTTTNTTNNTTNVTNNTNNGTSRPSLVALTVSRDGESIRRGDTLEYIINYKNVSSTRSLRNVILQVAMPKDLEFIEASRGSFSTDDRALIANIGSLAPQEEGVVRMRVKVSGDAEVNKIVVVSANMAYTIVDNNTQEEVFAYSTNNVSTNGNSDSQFGALAFLGGDGFLPSTLLGWLILIMLGTLLVLAVKKAYKGPANSNPTNVPSDHH